jgi:hypothetical protein
VEFKKSSGDGYISNMCCHLLNAITSYLGVSLLAKIKLTIEGEARATRDFEEFTASLPAEKVATWEKQVLDWHRDPKSNEDPYHTLWQGMSETISFTFRCLMFRSRRRARRYEERVAPQREQL